MATTRALRETLFLRRDFTPAERLEMGASLAQAHNRIAAIADEEASMKAGIKERKASVELTIGGLSRKLNDGYDMENTVCTLHYDLPNIGEVTYRRPDGSNAKVRPMTLDERQEVLPFDESGTGPVVAVPPEASAENIDGFFGKPDEPSAEDLDAVAEDQAAADATALPDGYEAEVRQSMGAPEPFPATLKEQLEQSESAGPSNDDIWNSAVKTLKNHPKVSAGFFQRELKVSYTKAAHLIDKMQDQKLIDKDGAKIVAPKKSGPKELAAEHAKQVEEGW
jgi:hypothetical protein